MSKYDGMTLGKWVINDTHGKRYIEQAESEFGIAIVCNESKSECLANARLLADAPMLLDQRDRLLGALNYVLEDEPSGIPRASSSCRGVLRKLLAEIEATK